MASTLIPRSPELQSCLLSSKDLRINRRTKLRQGKRTSFFDVKIAHRYILCWEGQLKQLTVMNIEHINVEKKTNTLVLSHLVWFSHNSDGVFNVGVLLVYMPSWSSDIVTLISIRF